MSRLGKIVAVIALFLMFLSAAAVAGGLYARFEQTNRNRADNARIWHAVVCDIERQVAASRKNDDPRLTTRKKQEFLRFYDNLLVHDAHALPCNITINRR